MKNCKKIPVLCYHDIMKTKDYNKLTEEEKAFVIEYDVFEKQMKLLKKLGYKTLTMDEFYKWKKGEIKLPYKSVLITFDDGYENVYKYAMPILKENNLKSCVFIIASKLNDVKDYISISQIKDSQKKYPNIEFCSHSYDLHVRGSVESKKLSELEKDIKQYEKSMGKCKYFAYPFGHYTNEMIESLKSHDYKLAFIFEMPKKVKKNENDYLIPRINTSFSQSTFKFFLKIILPFIY